MASPIAWVHHYNVLLPVYLVALKVAIDLFRGMRAASALLLLGTSLILTGLPLVTPYGPTVPTLNLIQSHVFVGVCLLIGVLIAEMFVYSKTNVTRTPEPHRL